MDGVGANPFKFQQLRDCVWHIKCDVIENVGKALQVIDSVFLKHFDSQK